MKLKFVFCQTLGLCLSLSLGRELSEIINFETETKSALTCRRVRDILAKTQSQGVLAAKRTLFLTLVIVGIK